MMNELDAARYETVLPLVRQCQIPGYSSYAFAVLEGRQPGHVFVDDERAPRSALVVNLAAPSLACGSAAGEWFGPFLQELLARLPDGQVLALRTDSSEWHRILATLPAVTRRRTVFAYEPVLASETLEVDADYPLPSGCRLARIDEPLARSLQEGLDRWGVSIWGGPAGFAQGSVGFCILAGDRIVSACTAAFIGGGAAELSIVTDEAFRRLGLASAACRALIRHCAAHGLRPDWSCNSDNVASAALAGKLGFVRRLETQGYLLRLTAPPGQRA